MLGVERGRERQDFQGHFAPEGKLRCLVHDAHAATTDLAVI